MIRYGGEELTPKHFLAIEGETTSPGTGSPRQSTSANRKLSGAEGVSPIDLSKRSTVAVLVMRQASFPIDNLADSQVKAHVAFGDISETIHSCRYSTVYKHFEGYLIVGERLAFWLILALMHLSQKFALSSAFQAAHWLHNKVFESEIV